MEVTSQNKCAGNQSHANEGVSGASVYALSGVGGVHEINNHSGYSSWHSHPTKKTAIEILAHPCPKGGQRSFNFQNKGVYGWR